MKPNDFAKLFYYMAKCKTVRVEEGMIDAWYQELSGFSDENLAKGFSYLINSKEYPQTAVIKDFLTSEDSYKNASDAFDMIMLHADGKVKIPKECTLIYNCIDNMGGLETIKHALQNKEKLLFLRSQIIKYISAHAEINKKKRIAKNSQKQLQKIIGNDKNLIGGNNGK